MRQSILYLGDTSLREAAGYLAGVMDHAGLGFEYLDSDRPFEAHLLEAGFGAVILSDYPSKLFTPSQLTLLAQKVEKGLGLVMIGGWDSFTGAEGKYGTTILNSVLPVEMRKEDDRVNCYQPCIVEKVSDHAILGDLPFDSHPPTIGGFNRLEATPDGEVILSARRFEVRREGGSHRFEAVDEGVPLLVVGSHGEGRTCAFAGDVAPHWVGGLVDWGDSRVQAQAAGASPVEVGNWYARLFTNIVRWAARRL